MQMQSSRRRWMRFSLRGLLVAVLVLCAFLAGRMPVLRRAQEAEERVRDLRLANDLRSITERIRLTGIVADLDGKRTAWIIDRHSGDREFLQPGETLKAGERILTLTEIGRSEVRFETGGSSLRLVVGD